MVFPHVSQTYLLTEALVFTSDTDVTHGSFEDRDLLMDRYVSSKSIWFTMRDWTIVSFECVLLPEYLIVFRRMMTNV